MKKKIGKQSKERKEKDILKMLVENKIEEK